MFSWSFVFPLWFYACVSLSPVFKIRWPIIDLKMFFKYSGY